MNKKKPPTTDETPSFEESLAELEQIVAKLEGGKLALADSLAAYEQGVKRLGGCYQMLEGAERKIDLVQSVDASGRAKTEPFDDADHDDLEEKSAARSRRRSAKPEGANGAPRGRVDDGSGLF